MVLFYNFSLIKLIVCVQVHISHISRKPFLPYANNKDADQPARLQSQISAFAVCFLDIMILTLGKFKIS